MRRTRPAVALSAAVMVGVASCAGAPGEKDDGAVERKNTDRSAIGNAMNVDEKAPAAPIKGAQKGGKLTVYSSGAPETFDPTRIYYTDSGAISKLVFRALTQYKYDAKSKKMILVPDLATDLGRPNKDFTRWEFTLRKGVKYDNGEPIRAQDVAYAIKRQFAQEELTAGPTYGLDYFADGDKYVGPYKPAKKNGDGEFGGKDFKAVETPDDRTVVIKMRKPFADLRYYASYPTFSPIPEKADTGVDYERDPLATGPYKFKKYRPGVQLTLERNPEWDPKTDTTRHQYIEEFDFRFGEDTEVRQKQVLLDKGVDQSAIMVDDILSSTYSEVEKQNAESRIMKGRGRCTDFSYFDTRKVPLEVRKAAAVAWPLENEAKVGGKVPGLTWTPSTTIIPSITPGWNKYDVLGNGGKGNGNPDKARQMLKKAGKLNFELSMPFSSDDTIDEKVAQARKDGLEKAGFKVQLVSTTEAQVRTLINDPKADINVRHQGWCTDWPSGGAIFPSVWDGRKVRLGDATIPTFLNDPKINAEIDRISGLPAEEGLKAWGELDEKVMRKHMPAVIRGEGDVAMLRGSKVGNAVVDEAKSMPYYSGMYLKK